MSKKCLDFLHNSFLFDCACIENNYAQYNDKMIIQELQKYRDYVIKNLVAIKGEIIRKDNRLNVSIETFNKLPSEELYKQLVLYIDQVIIPDPLFKLTAVKQPIQDVMSEFLGVKKDKGLDRTEIIDAINYIKCIATLISFRFVVMLPLTLMHEAPKEIPINYSPTSFSDILPDRINKFYRSIAIVENMENDDSGLKILNSPLKLGTKIFVRFPDDNRTTGMANQYFESKILDFDKKTGKAKFAFRPADSISEPTFNAWVNQSINQAAIQHFSEKYSDLIFAQTHGCMYLTQSTLTSTVLSQAIERQSKNAELASKAIQMELPVLNQLPLSDIINIRQDYGEAFHNFRAELNSKLNNVTAKNEEELELQLEQISYELNNVQVSEIQKEYRKISRTLKLDAIACTGSLIASFATGGITAVGAAATFVKSLADISKYYTNVHEHNGFLLWKLNNQARKYQ